jgi:hypothetical protein
MARSRAEGTNATIFLQGRVAAFGGRRTQQRDDLSDGGKIVAYLDAGKELYKPTLIFA